MPDANKPPTLPELEALPYLTAVIQEGLRLCQPVTHRLGRAFPEKTLNYHGKSIPTGTRVNMTHVLMHHDKRIFPDPEIFNPDRWLGEKKRLLEKYLVPFNRGTRACLGLNLARAELYLILACVYRRFDFDVSQVKKERDIDVSYDFILAAQAKDSPGILVKVKMAEKS